MAIPPGHSSPFIQDNAFHICLFVCLFVLVCFVCVCEREREKERERELCNWCITPRVCCVCVEVLFAFSFFLLFRRLFVFPFFPFLTHSLAHTHSLRPFPLFGSVSLSLSILFLHLSFLLFFSFHHPIHHPSPLSLTSNPSLSLSLFLNRILILILILSSSHSYPSFFLSRDHSLYSLTDSFPTSLLVTSSSPLPFPSTPTPYTHCTPLYTHTNKHLISNLSTKPSFALPSLPLPF